MQINIIEYFEKTVCKYKDKVAVIEGDNQFSFKELEIKSKKLSRLIVDKTSNIIRKPIAIFTQKSINAIVANLATIYSGNAYMNLDVKTPLTRIKAILDLIQPALIITNSKYYNNISSVFNSELIVNIDEVDFELQSFTQDEIEQTLYPILDTDPLCIINTSGSTGTPKGVVLNHRSFIDFTDWANTTMDFSDDEVLGCLSPIVFDIYSYELCLMMSKAATMVLLDGALAAFPARILQTLVNHSVTFIFWVPTIMVNIANMGLLDKIPLNTLKIVWFAGEVFPTKQYNIWHKALPNTRFVNMYGPIEITLDCTHFIIDRELSDVEPIPIGFAMRNTDILLLNEENRLCKKGEEGELCVRGSSLAMGYYNNPEKTQAAFVQNPLNNSYPELIYRTGDLAVVNERGEIIFKGRKDTLIKHSGYRIELGEIEHIIINTLKLVKNGCCVYDYAKKEIVFYFEQKEGISVIDIKKSMTEVVPKYMIPNRFVEVVQMPRNANGKIDRLQLKNLLG